MSYRSISDSEYEDWAGDRELTFAATVHELREKLVALQNAPHEEHAGPICPICVLTNRMLRALREQSDD